MSFYDDPIVDDNSKRSEESVNVVRSLFTRKNGFISREEYPDYGVDLDIELIVDGANASSHKFPIQIKSVINIKKIKQNDDVLISYEFRTSRLSYLAKRPPAYGIFALYDDTKRVCYFDYIDDIIRRLDESLAREGWREQEHVNILLPVQELNTAVLPSLHERFLKRHENRNLMLQEHGQKFSIPTLDQKPVSGLPRIDFQDPEQVANFLEKFGGLLYNEAEFGTLNQLLGLISRTRLNTSPQLIFLAATTYTQTGHIIDAEYYIRKARKIPEVMQGEGTGMIEFAAARLEFIKGNIDYEFFLKTFEGVIDDAKTLENKLALKINILFFELARGMDTGSFPSDYEKKVEDLYDQIEAADIPVLKKHLLKCHHADSQFHFALRGEIEHYSDVKLKEGLNKPMLVAEKLDKAMHFIKLIDGADKTVYEAYVFGCAHENSLLEATAAHHIGQHFLSRRSSFLLFWEEDKMPQDKVKLVEMYERNQNFSIIAYGQFLELNMFQNAHEALGTAYEINQLCIHLTGTSVGRKSPKELMAILRQIEEEFDLQPFESGVANAVEKLKEKDAKDGRHLKDKSDEQIVEMATKIIAGLGLPSDRIPNLVHDMHMVRKFEQEVANPKIVMRQDIRHTFHPSTYYASLPLYILRHSNLGIETKPSSDIDQLLSEFSTILKQTD